MSQLAELSDDDVAEELELLQSTDLSAVEYMPARVKGERQRGAAQRAAYCGGSWERTCVVWSHGLVFCPASSSATDPGLPPLGILALRYLNKRLNNRLWSKRKQQQQQQQQMAGRQG